MSRVIEVLVSAQGEVSIQTQGYVGSACLQASKFLEQALGVTTQERKTAEYFQTTDAEQRLQQQ